MAQQAKFTQRKTMKLTASLHVSCSANTLLGTVFNSRWLSEMESWQNGSVSSERQLPLNSNDTSSTTKAHALLWFTDDLL